MQKPLISVIIPVYNVEEYLPRCMDSVLYQTYQNIEVLLINDGSTDASGQICDRYAAQDDRVVVWHRVNGGPSAARNYGIEQAKGEYLLFVDSDDMISVDHIQFLYEKLQKADADLAICNYTATDSDTFAETQQTMQREWAGEQALEYLLYQKYFTTGPVCKLFRKCLFEKVRFPVGTLYEDTLAIAQVVGKAKTVVYSDAVKYGYYQRSNSTMRLEYRPETMQYVSITAELMEYIEREFPALTPAAISRFVWANIFVWIKMPCGFRDDKEVLVRQNIKKYRWQVLRNPKVRIQNKVALVASCFGQRAIQTMYRWKRSI